jgi:NAD(P)-dependent dehydrogenase (short-subunit alcohol dehydrogenase family)
MIPGSEQLAKFAQKRNPFNRLTMPSDVANVVYLLCTKEAAWINGTVIKVDGGESLQ